MSPSTALAQQPDASATPLERTLADGNVYQLHPLTLSDRDAMETWMRSKLIAAAILTIDDMGDSMSDEAREFTMQQAYQAAGRLWLESRNARGMLISVDGQWRMLLMSLRHAKKQADLSLSDVKRLAPDPATIDKLVADLLEISRPFFGMGIAPKKTPSREGADEEEAA